MPKGRFPFRRTFEFLSGGRLVIKSDIKSVVLNYTHKPESRGLRNFLFKDLPQLQFKNKAVQFLTMKNKTPHGNVNLFYGDGRKVMIDVENMTGPEILDTFGNVAGATESQNVQYWTYPVRSVGTCSRTRAQNGWESLSQTLLDNSFLSELQARRQPKYPGRRNLANFGKHGHCYCICMKPGQVPCPSMVPRPEVKKPKVWQAKSGDQ